MLFRFTLNNTISGSHVISDPDGWKEMTVKLSRDKEYHSLIEMVEVPLRFYRTSDLVDGGYDYIINVEQTQGINAIIEILIEVSIDQGTTYETFFEGLLELSTIKDISDAESFIIECNIVRNDFWSKFFNRRSQQVDLTSVTDLDGNVISAVNESTIYLPSQSIRQSFERDVNYNDGNDVGFSIAFGSGSTTNYLIWDNSRFIVDEVLDRFEYGSQVSTEDPTNVSKYIYQIKYDGTYRFQAGVRYTFSLSASRNYDIRWYYALRQNGTLSASVQFGSTQTGTSLFWSDDGVKSLDLTVTLKSGDEFYIYGVLILSSGTSTLTYFPDYDSDLGAGFAPVYTSFEVTANTTYKSTTTDAYLLRDAAESILTKLIGRNEVLYSEYLGEDSASPCGANFAVMKGVHVRGYSMTDKPMFLSFDDWWDGANPIFNLGLGYEEIAGTEYIRIEDKSHFYDETPSLTLNNIDKLVRTYDKDRIFKSIEIGYQKWSAESASGIDDPQTKHTYNTEFKIIGKDDKQLSKFIAASLAIEQTRRNRVELGKDWRLDEDTLIIALGSDSSPLIAELSQNFSGVSNLLNSSTRYNIRLTPGRNFERWIPMYNGCLQPYIGSNYMFGSGEGNIDMSSNGTGSCDTSTITENQDFPITSDHYTSAQSYEFEKELSFEDYKTIRDNRNSALLVSQTSSGHKLFFIEVLEWDHFNSMGKFTGWIKE